MPVAKVPIVFQCQASIQVIIDYVTDITLVNPNADFDQKSTLYEYTYNMVWVLWPKV